MSRGGERCGKAHVMRQMGTEKANVSEPLMRRRKRSGDMPKPGSSCCPGISLAAACLLARRVSGVKVARARFRLRCGTWEPLASICPVVCWRGRRKGEPQVAEAARGRGLMRGRGADRLVVAMKVL